MNDKQRYGLCMRCMVLSMPDTYSTQYDLAIRTDIRERCDKGGPWQNPYWPAVGAGLCSACPFAVEHVVLAGEELGVNTHRPAPAQWRAKFER